ncbi:PhoU family transcriptional regulator [Ureibacillus chungkukjangi]|uniref:Lipoprotein n=1 Tax=Ureibacillus chungkukjangi TaxID=1202712 RepID=A0A318TB12_9BACL|nr:PhoU family transcriptional regulator [Ureibacillus chungkukjangi]MCM3387796.1 PhoU family transcriptional regulator [Ureibacillus chungkukjangi]PYF01773.1 hypothetical protein BJ095_1563 [Ureibacillus chungkukjangi]
MKRILVYLSLLFILIACSNEQEDNSTSDVYITKAFIEENAEIGLTFNEVRERFGTEVLSVFGEGMDNWLYDSAQYSDFKYDRTIEVVAFDEILSGDLEYQLYINFREEKALMYSYFYLGEDGKVWQYQINPYNEPLDIPVSN